MCCTCRQLGHVAAEGELGVERRRALLGGVAGASKCVDFPSRQLLSAYYKPTVQYARRWAAACDRREPRAKSRSEGGRYAPRRSCAAGVCVQHGSQRERVSRAFTGPVPARRQVLLCEYSIEAAHAPPPASRRHLLPASGRVRARVVAWLPSDAWLGHPACLPSKTEEVAAVVAEVTAGTGSALHATSCPTCLDWACTLASLRLVETAVVEAGLVVSLTLGARLVEPSFIHFSQPLCRCNVPEKRCTCRRW